MATVAFWHHLGKLLHHPVFHFPTQIVLRDGSYGLPFAALTLREDDTYGRTSLSPPEHFHSVESLHQFQSLLDSWLRRALNSLTAGKVRGTLSWLPHRNRTNLILPHRFSKVDVHRLLQGCPHIALRDPIANTKLDLFVLPLTRLVCPAVFST